MYLTTGLEREMEKFLDMAPQMPTTLGGIVEFLGGPLEAAKELGYNPPQGDKNAERYAARVVQRYTNYEKYGKTPSNRKISADSLDKLQQAASDKIFGGLVDSFRDRGLKTQGRMKLYVSNGATYVGERNISATLQGPALDDFIDAWLDMLLGTGSVENMAAAYTVAVMDTDRAHGGYDFPGAEIDVGPDALERDDFEISYAN